MKTEEKCNKKCSRCRTYRYPIEFFNKKGRELKTCHPCREKDKIYREKIKKEREKEEEEEEREEMRVREMKENKEERDRETKEERDRLDMVERIMRIERLDMIESRLFNDPYERRIVRDLLQQLRSDISPDFKKDDIRSKSLPEIERFWD